MNGGQDVKGLSALLGHTRAYVTRQGYREYLPQTGQGEDVCGPCDPIEDEMRQAADVLGELFKL